MLGGSSGRPVGAWSRRVRRNFSPQPAPPTPPVRPWSGTLRTRRLPSRAPAGEALRLADPGGPWCWKTVTTWLDALDSTSSPQGAPAARRTEGVDEEAHHPHVLAVGRDAVRPSRPPRPPARAGLRRGRYGHVTEGHLTAQRVRVVPRCMSFSDRPRARLSSSLIRSPTRADRSRAERLIDQCQSSDSLSIPAIRRPRGDQYRATGPPRRSRR